jgi:hypothetical protein
MEDIINELATNARNKNIRHLYIVISESKKSDKPRSNLMEDKNDVLLADSHNILIGRRTFFLSY